MGWGIEGREGEREGGGADLKGSALIEQTKEVRGGRRKKEGKREGL